MSLSGANSVQPDPKGLLSAFDYPTSLKGNPTMIF